MAEENILVMDRGETRATIMQWVAIVGIVVVAPMFHQQLLTGIVVNAALFMATVLLSARMGIVAGLFPSVVALSVGTLPAVLAPMVPYIMIGNAILILAFDQLRRKNFWLAVGVGSFLKFLFLYVSSFLVVGLLAQKELASGVVTMMSWPQLVTAVLGGVVAFGVLRVLGGSSTSK